MRRRNELTKEEFETEMERIRIDLVGAGVEVEYSLVDRNQLGTLLEQAKLFLTNLEPLYLGFSIDNKQRFAAFLFPKGVRYADGEIRTPEKSYLFTVLDNMKTGSFKNSLMVNHWRVISNTLLDTYKSFSNISQFILSLDTQAKMAF